MRTFFSAITLLLLLLPLSPDAAFCQEQETAQIRTQYIYIVKSLDIVNELNVTADVTRTSSGISAVTSGEGSSYFYDNSCIMKEGVERQEEGDKSRMIADCISGGSMIVTTRPGQVKIAFTNSTGEKGGGFSSGLVYTNFVADSAVDLLLW